MAAILDHGDQVQFCYFGLLHVVAIIILLCLTIVLYKLMTNQNFSIGFRIGIQSNREDRDNLVLEPILLRRAGQQQPANRNNNANIATPAVDPQVDTI